MQLVKKEHEEIFMFRLIGYIFYRNISFFFFFFSSFFSFFFFLINKNVLSPA